MKKNQKKVEVETLTEEDLELKMPRRSGKKKFVLLGGIFLFSTAVALTWVSCSEIQDVLVSEEETVNLVSVPVTATASKKGVISIPAGTVKANPFVPYRDISGTQPGLDVPSYNLVAPPETLDMNSDAARLMDTTVSGILFDKYNPSAILNIEGVDHLVKKGDVVNNYKVISIAQDAVTVQLGANVYKAGIGEILTEGALNHNDVSNLNKKFGGERQ